MPQNYFSAMTATVKMHSLKAMAENFRPNDPDVALDSLNTAWRRAQTQGDLQLGKFGRSREDLTNYENDFALDWFKADKLTPSVQTPDAAHQNDILALQRDKKALQGEKTTLITAYNAEKLAKETALKTVADLINETKLLQGQIDGLQAQIKSHAATGSRELGNQERLLNGQIAILTGQLDKANDALKSIDKSWTDRVETKENAFNKALQAADTKLVEATEAYQNQIAENDKAWQKRLDASEAKNAQLVTAHEAELAPYLQAQAERDASVTVLEVINYGEILAAIVGAIAMFNWVGAVLGFPAALFYYDSMQTVKKANSWQSAQFAIFVCAVLSVAFAFVHYNTALKYNESDAFPKWIVAICAAIILSGTSVAAIYQNYLKKTENA